MSIRRLSAFPIFLLFVSALMAGCATMPDPVGQMLPGKMYSLQDGTELNFEIQTSYGTGAMTAYNPVTGEKFSGQYTGIYTGGGASQSNVTNSWGFSTGSVTTQSAPTGAIAKGILRGDRGTIINVSLNIQPGARPTGFGEGTDNKGVRYQIQF